MTIDLTVPSNNVFLDIPLRDVLSLVDPLDVQLDPIYSRMAIDLKKGNVQPMSISLSERRALYFPKIVEALRRSSKDDPSLLDLPMRMKLV